MGCAAAASPVFGVTESGAERTHSKTLPRIRKRHAKNREVLECMRSAPLSPGQYPCEYLSRERFLAERMIDQHQSGHRFDHRDGAREDARIVTAAAF